MGAGGVWGGRGAAKEKRGGNCFPLANKVNHKGLRYDLFPSPLTAFCEVHLNSTKGEKKINESQQNKGNIQATGTLGPEDWEADVK